MNRERSGCDNPGCALCYGSRSLTDFSYVKFKADIPPPSPKVPFNSMAELLLELNSLGIKAELIYEYGG